MSNGPDAIADHNRAQYNSKGATVHSRKDRAQGPAAPLKLFHNNIKRYLLTTFASGADAVLDVACGRGGDLAKWSAAGVKRVFGVDNSIAEIEEARRRYRAGSFATRCDFQVRDDLTTATWDVGQFDVVSCMFALHYFCPSEATLKHVIDNAAKSLKPGGYLIGTVADGARIRQAIAEGWGGSMLRIQPLWSGPSKRCGSPYMCTIADTVVSSGSIEYLVDETLLADIAKSSGFEPVTLRDHPYFEPGGGAVFNHFSPKFPGSNDRSLERASRLFAAFVFQKRR